MLEIACPWPHKPYSLEFACGFNMDLGPRRKGNEGLDFEGIAREGLKGRRQVCVEREPGGQSTPGRQSKLVGFLRGYQAFFFNVLATQLFLKVKSRSWRFEGGRRRRETKKPIDLYC